MFQRFNAALMSFQRRKTTLQILMWLADILPIQRSLVEILKL